MSTVNGVKQNSIAPKNPLSLQGPAPQGQVGASTAPKAKNDGSNISGEAKKKPQDSERTDLLDAIKKNYGGNDRFQTSERKFDKLTKDQLKDVKKKREFDKALTKHEEDHHEVAADLARSGPLYETEVGADGETYRKSGKVMIDTGATEDPEKTVKKMRQVKAAALAPDGNQLAPLSDQDKKVAREATEKEKKAQSQLDGNTDAKFTEKDKKSGGSTF